MNPKLKTVYQKFYDSICFVALASLTLGLFYYGSLMVLFFFNSSWIVPTRLSVTSDKMLQFASGYQQSLQNYETLQAATGQAEREWKIAQTNLNNIERLRSSFNDYSTRAAQIGNDKLRDIHTSTLLKGSLDVTIVSTIDSQRAGLITQSDAAQTLAGIQQFQNSVTDSKMALNNEIITTNTSATQLAAQYLQAQSDVQTKHDLYVAAQDSLVVAQRTLDTLVKSSYFTAMNDNGANLAFVSYDNLKHAKIGEPIYDCIATVILCRKVGTVTKVYDDEQVIEFPLFNVSFSKVKRGVLVKMDMTRPASMTSQILFVGSKPLFL